MKDNVMFTLLGGDMRQVHLAELLCTDGHAVQLFGLDQLTFPPDIQVLERWQDRKEGIVILPMPVLQDERHINAPLSRFSHAAEPLISQLPPGTLVLGGGIPPALTALGEQKGLCLVDYLRREELAILNAIPTAEGALQIALEEMPITLHDCPCLIIGGQTGRFQDFNPMACCQFSNRAGVQGATTPTPGIGAGDHRLHGVLGGNQCLQDRCGGLWGSSENNTHKR